MTAWERLAIYYTPAPGAFADASAAWLGWDSAAGREVLQPAMAGLSRPLAEITAAPRQYGLHGTLRAPFRLAGGLSLTAVEARLSALAAELEPVVCGHLRIADLHGFLALWPEGDQAPLARLAAAVVEGTDQLRAPLTAAERARRRPETLSARQRALLDRWGYPYVMDEFFFHITLTGQLAAEERAEAQSAAEAWFSPVLPSPFEVSDICLLGQDAAGRFSIIRRFAMGG